MGRTQLTGDQIKDGTILREDLNTTTSGQAVITKALPGSGITMQSTGADEGTGDVTFSAGLERVDKDHTNNGDVVSSNTYLICDSTSAAFTLKLPPNPEANDEVYFLDLKGSFATNNLTIDRNGNNIDGVQSNVICDVDDLELKFMFMDSTSSDVGWKLVVTQSFSQRIWSLQIVDDDYEANVNDHIWLDGDGTSAINITLPTSAEVNAGDRIKVTDLSGLMTSNATIINRNGSNIMKLAENFNINTNYVTCTFTYLDSTRGWGIEF